MTWRSFKEARKFVHSLKLKSGTWQDYCKSGKRPDDIPPYPDKVYKNKGWISRGDWLGTGYVQPSKRQYRSFKEARKYIQSLKLKNTTDWNRYCTSGKKPDDIPSQPHKIYKKEWKNWKYFIGNEFLSYKEAGKFLRKQGITSQPQYERWVKDGKRPNFIPATPSKTYKLKGTWNGWGEFLGTGKIADQIKATKYLLWPEAKKEYQKLAKKYGLIGYSDWQRFLKTHKNLLEQLNIPASPWQTYTKERVWRKMKK